MKKALRIFFIAFIISNFLGCHSNSNEKANELFVKAINSDQRMREESKSYSEALSSFKKTKAYFDDIISEYPSSDIAVRLLSGEAKISGLTLSDFKKIEDSIVPYANAEINNNELVLFLSEKIEGDVSRAFTKADIALMYAEANQKDKAVRMLDEALVLVVKNQDKGDKSFDLRLIADKYAAIQEFDKAIEVLNQITNETHKSYTWRAIAHQYAKSGRFEEAIEMANNIRDENTKLFGWVSIARQYAEHGNKNEAYKLLSKTLEEAKKNEGYNLEGFLLRNIATQYADLDYMDQALIVLKQIRGERDKSRALLDIVAIHAKKGSFEKALELAENIKDKEFNSWAFSNIAKYFADDNKFDQAFYSANRIEDEIAKSWALLMIAEKHSNDGQIEDLNRVLDQVINLDRKNKSKIDQAWILSGVSKSYEKVGLKYRAKNSLLAMLEIIQDYEKDFSHKISSTIDIVLDKEFHSETDLDSSTILNFYYPIGSFWKKLRY